MQMQNLNAQTIALSGKHLIEASAGTGKTFNITRLYLRLLLERRLPVEKILVMTFTKDATEELKGRIESFIREAIQHWSTLIEEDSFFIEIAKKVSTNEALALLKTALLFLDEAAIFTIHGFCKRVLSEHAFTSGLPFNAIMEADSQELVVESCQDYYRILAQDEPEQFLLLAQFWSDPLKFLSHFSQAIASHHALDVLPVENIASSFLQLVKAAYDDLDANEQSLITYLVDVKKGQDRELRQQELIELKTWLKEVSLTSVDDFVEVCVKSQLGAMPDAFIDGRRYGRSTFKNEIIQIFSNVYRVKEQAKTLSSQFSKAMAFKIVREGIYTIREAVSVKKQKLNMLTFDDLITTLANCLTVNANTSQEHITDEQKRQLATTLLEQYPVALVDEFQDTDPLQFSILKAIYYHTETLDSTQATLYMIGDPKQAIYGFRGGDVFAYLAARQDCDYQWLMDTNWRSTPAMVTGYNRLFYGNTLNQAPGDVFGYNIPYLPVKAAKTDEPNANRGIDGNKALQFVHFDEVNDSAKNGVKQSFRSVMANWCANEIIRLFNADPHLKAQDIAILVRDGTEAQSIKQALQQHQLASVFLSNRANLLHSRETKQMLALLKGILFVENERWYTAALACGLLGFTADKLYQLQCDELAWQNLKFSFAAYRDEWLNKGFISMALKLMHQHFHIGEDDQDRVLTNLLHLFELLQSASGRHKQPQELLYWFEQQIMDENTGNEAELRLESDDDLIRIVTQHGAKGLEYPIVFVPFVTRFKDPLRFGSSAVNFIKYHQLVESSQPNLQKRKLILSLDGSLEAKQAMAEEAYAESIRLLYVAVTRAEQQCYLLTADFENCHQSPLGLTLKWQKEQSIRESLQSLTSDNPNEIGLLTIEYHETDENASLNESLDNNHLVKQITPQVAQFKGHIERDWWLSSFSALSKNLRHGGVSTPDRDIEVIKSEHQETNLVSNTLRFILAKGAHTGNLLHDILEHTDFVQADWQGSMKYPLIKYGELAAGFTEADLQSWLQEVLHAPLAEANCTLADIVQTKTLRESEFYFPMESASSARLSSLLTAHRRSGDAQLKHSPMVQLPSYQTLKGMMHGFIDLIFEHQGQYFVCDYKSSHLGDRFDDYQKVNLRENIENNYYDLQYLIYCLALHRHLKHTIEDYDPTLHFGGIYYFYLRGMTDDHSHQGAGVYYRKITVEELEQLDDIFSGKQTQSTKNTLELSND